MIDHLSEDEVAGWLTGEALTPDRRRHAEECGRCQSELAQLEQLFVLFRESGSSWSQHWYAEARFAGRRRYLWPLSAAAAACAFAALLLFVPPVAPRRPAQVPGAAGGPFLAIPYTVPPAPYERTKVVRMNLPVAALIAAGFDVHATDAGATLRADVLVGQDGRMFAVRAVPGSDSKETYIP